METMVKRARKIALDSICFFSLQRQKQLLTDIIWIYFLIIHILGATELPWSVEIFASPFIFWFWKKSCCPQLWWAEQSMRTQKDGELLWVTRDLTMTASFFKMCCIYAPQDTFAVTWEALLCGLWMVSIEKKCYNLQYFTLTFAGNSTRTAYLLSFSPLANWGLSLSCRKYNFTAKFEFCILYVYLYSPENLREYQASHTVNANMIHIRIFRITPKAHKEMQRCILNCSLPTS